jgi:hypothetical protein
VRQIWTESLNFYESWQQKLFNRSPNDMFCISDRALDFEPQNEFNRFYVYSLNLNRKNNDLSILIEQEEESSQDLT